jgi:riboflavin synthase
VGADASLLRYIVPKGYVAIDGTSLTVVDVQQPAAEGGGGGRGWFTFMLISYTQRHVIIPLKAEGEAVNIETDVLGKYTERATASLVDAMQRLAAKTDAAFANVLDRLDKLSERVAVLENKR